jgi:sugar lactone lactonase YvrE
MYGKMNVLTPGRRMALIVGLLLVMVLPGVALAQSTQFPDVINLPVGYAPEGIATGRGTSFYAGSLANGSVYGGDLRTGEGAIVVPPQPGRISVGMKLDPRSNYLFVAGGPTGQAYVYDAGTGVEVALLQLAAPGANFINDVIVTRDAAYFTNSAQPYFYRVPLGPGGRLSDPATSEAVMLTGDWVQGAGFNSNGIAATPDGSTLFIVNSGAGKLYRVDPATGVASLIDLGGESVGFGDGILLDGKTLYVVRNRLNLIAAFQMSPDFASGALTKTINDSDFNVPTTVAQFGNSLYAVNAKFGTPSAGTPYEVVKVSK